MKKLIRVLVTDVTSYKTIVFCRSLKQDRRFLIIAGDHRPYAMCLRTRWIDKFYLYANCERYPTGFLTDIKNIIKKEEIDYLIPANSSQIRLCLKKRRLFGKTLDLFGPYEKFLALDDKTKFTRLAKNLKIRVPTEISPKDFKKKFVDPVVIKPKSSAGSKGLFYLKTKKQFENFIRNHSDLNLSNYLIQEYIEGNGVGYSLICKKGRIIASFGHKRIGEFPINGGPSTIRENFEHPDFLTVAQKIVSKLKWTGYIMFEFKLAKDDSLYLIEANPRVWGSINQGVVNGIDFPKLPFGFGEKRLNDKNYITVLSPLAELSLFLYIIKKLNFAPLVYVLKNIKRVRCDVSPLNDPRGYLSLILRSFYGR